MKVTTSIAAASVLGVASAWPTNYQFSERALDNTLPVKQFATTVSNGTLPNATGRSYTVPPVYANGGKAWQAAFSRAVNLTSQLTLAEKLTLVEGQVGRCAGNTGNITRLGLKSICLQDGPTGVRPATGKSQFPAGVTTAATWDRELMYNRSLAMGQEFYDLGVNVALAPVTGGPLGRAPREGRNWEGWATDPYATGVGAYYSVTGLQDAGVLATAKHYVAYESETYRNIYGLTASYSVFPASEQLPISSNVDEKTNHELYLWGFAEAVRAGTSLVMCSYNMVNGTHSCANSETLNGDLKTELNFQGSVVSDWGATWGTEAFVMGGEDLDMPGLNYGGELGTFWNDELVALVNNGTIPEERINDQIHRLLTPYFHSGQADVDFPSTTINALSLPEYETIYRPVQKLSTVALINKIGQDGAVLLKNVDGALPLKKPQRIAVIGTDAGPNPYGYQSCGAFGDACPGLENANNGTFSDGFGSGYSQPFNLVDPLAAILARAVTDQTLVQAILNDTDLDDVMFTATGADVALVFVQAYADEGQDRETLELTGNGAALINATASVNNNTIVILHIPGVTILDSWVNHPNITAVLAPLLPGEQTGNSLVSILYGDVSPSGKLPFTIGTSESQYPPNTIVTDPVVAPQSNFTEKLLIDYRWFDAKNETPQYEFGFGLSYSTFEYSNIVAETTYEADSMAIQETNEKLQGLTEGSIYDTIFNVQATITNTGDVVACEVAQLYVQFPDSENEPPRQLRGFEKVKQLAVGASQTVTFPIRRKDVAVWDTVAHQWRIPEEAITFHVGASSRILPLSVSHTFA